MGPAMAMPIIIHSQFRPFDGMKMESPLESCSTSASSSCLCGKVCRAWWRQTWCYRWLSRWRFPFLLPTRFGLALKCDCVASCKREQKKRAFLIWFLHQRETFSWQYRLKLLGTSIRPAVSICVSSRVTKPTEFRYCVTLITSSHHTLQDSILWKFCAGVHKALKVNWFSSLW